jgi:pyruvyltransferase
VLTPLLFDRLLGIRLEWAELEDADLIAIGSLADVIPYGYAGAVLGTGSMFDRFIDLSSANVLALRGVLTARLAGLHPPLLADLGLLAADLARPARRNVAIGTVRADGDPRPAIGMALDPMSDAETFIASAARCQRIVSSSLHGLILADSLGIENMWDPYPPMPDFKFRDYASAYGERIVPCRWRLADQTLVACKQTALRAIMARY